MASNPIQGNKDTSHSIDASLNAASMAHTTYYQSPTFQMISASSPTVFRCPTLSTFLHQLNLTQYHPLFVDAGVEENDVEQLVSFDEAELKEVLEAISMKPFHSAAFKKGIRELRQTMNVNISRIISPGLSNGPFQISMPTMPSTQTPIATTTTSSSTTLMRATLTPPKMMNTPTPPRKKVKIAPAPTSSTPTSNLSHSEDRSPSPSIPMTGIQSNNPSSGTVAGTTNTLTLINNPAVSRDVIIQYATIYGKNSARQLTQYEQSINQAAIELALADPALVANKGELFEKAKRKLLVEGYTYKRGVSRSKLNPHAPKPGQRASREVLRAKRNQNAAMTSESRNVRIAELERKLEAKDVQHEWAQESKRHKTEQGDTAGLEKAALAITELEKERQEIVRELTNLKSKERKHQWYEKRKKERMDSGFEEGVDDMFNDNESGSDERHLKDKVSQQLSLLEESPLLHNEVKGDAYIAAFMPGDRVMKNNSSDIQPKDDINVGINHSADDTVPILQSTTIAVESGQQHPLY